MSGFSSMMSRLSKPDAMKQQAEKLTTSYPRDERYFQTTPDKKGNTTVIMRFLPAPEGETEDFVKFFTHYIKGGGKKYIERCRTSIGESDPAQELAQRKTGDEKADKAWYGKYGKTARFVGNVLILKDEGNPENNGKVFLYEFGIKIMRKILKAMEGSDDPMDPVEAIPVIVHPIEGANFKLVQTKQGENNNYDDSKVLAKSALFNGDIKKFEEVWKLAYPLQPLVDPSLVKSYEELEKLLISVVGADLVNSKGKTDDGDSDEGDDSTSAAPAKEAAKSSSNGTAKTNGAAPAKEAAKSEDADAVFNELLKNTQQAGLSADEAVDAMFDEK